MKFLCGNCKAKYQIADEKVTGRTLRMKCRRCGHDILIDGHSMQSSPPPAPPARRTSSTVSVVPGAGRAAAAMAAPANLPRPAIGRPKPPSNLSADFRRHVVAPPEVPQRTAPYDLWHVAIQDVPVGPMTRDELARKVESGAVTSESLCWREGMDDWRPFGELPELQQLARRQRDARGPRTRPHSVPAPPPTRPMPPPSDDDDDGGEPTRISEFMPSLSHSASVAPAAPAAGLGPSSTAQKLPAAPGPMQVVEPERSKGSSGMTTGIAIGMLVMILLLGGPKLFQLAWGSTPEAKPAPQPAVAVEKPTPTPAENVELPAEEPEEPKEEKVVARPAAGGSKAPRANKGDAPDKPKTLSDEQRRLLERMGGGGNDPDLRAVARDRSEQGSGGTVPAALTPQQLTKVVQDNKNQLQRCYETALRASGGKQDAAVKIKVSVVVGTSGTTKSVNTEGEGLGNMTDCIRGAVKRWRFPLAGGDSEFAFPLVFQPGA